VEEAPEDNESFETVADLLVDSSLPVVDSDAASEVLATAPSELVLNIEVSPCERVDCVVPVCVKCADIPLISKARLVKSEVMSVTEVKVRVPTASIIVRSTPSPRMRSDTTHAKRTLI
jgi:hypothetical protein